MSYDAVQLPRKKGLEAAGQRIRNHANDRVRASDDMRFTPGQIEVRQGETIKFVVTNVGRVRYEFFDPHGARTRSERPQEQPFQYRQQITQRSNARQFSQRC